MKGVSSKFSLEELFCGAATMGERGQVVIPAEARKDCHMESGDKLLVFTHPMNLGVMLVRVDALSEFSELIAKDLSRLSKRIEDDRKKEKE